VNAGAVRVLALWSPDWPVTAAARGAQIPAHRPAAVVVANRVLVCSALARARGVRRGQRRREAQARCPELAVLDHDPDRDVRTFEPVVTAVEELAPGVELVRPGLVALPARGPASCFGGELAAAERLVDHVSAHTGVECQVGFAEGLFAAVLAARRAVAVEPGRTRDFLAPLEVAELDRDPDVDRSELVDLLQRLGLRCLGAFGALDAEDVASRFGGDAVLAHRLARGLDPRPPARRHPPEELAVETELDPPADRVDTVAFTTRGLAEQLHHRLAGHALACTRLGVTARTVDGQELHRVWRCAQPLTPAGTVDRVRWQLDAWLTRHGVRESGDARVRWLRLVPEETVAAGALQLGLWGDVGEADERAGRALVRVQALLGPEAVVTAVLVGGREPAERVRFVPWGNRRPTTDPTVLPTTPRSHRHEDRAGSSAVPDPAVAALPEKRPSARATLPTAAPSAPADGSVCPPAPASTTRPVGPTPAGWPDDLLRVTGRLPPVIPPPAARRTRIGVRRPALVRRESGARSPGPRSHPSVPEPPAPWPGRLPAPSPATVPPHPSLVELRGAAGEPVLLAAPDLLTAVPQQVIRDGERRAVRSWAGPWPIQQRWWSADALAGSRLQLVCDDETALLLHHREGRWWVVGVYD